MLCIAASAVVAAFAYISNSRPNVYFDRAIFDIADKDVSLSTGGSIFNLPGSQGKIVRIWFSLTNAGNTTTKNARVVLVCRPIGVRGPNRQEPFALFNWSDTSAVSEIIGPKQTIVVGPCGAEFESILNAQMGIEPIYIMGEIRYEDQTLPWTRNRITRFSQQIVITRFEPEKGIILASTRSVGKNNCVDEDCVR
jgi:hypothetical protein